MFAGTQAQNSRKDPSGHSQMLLPEQIPGNWGGRQGRQGEPRLLTGAEEGTAGREACGDGRREIRERRAGDPPHSLNSLSQPWLDLPYAPHADCPFHAKESAKDFLGQNSGREKLSAKGPSACDSQVGHLPQYNKQQRLKV